MNHRAIAVALSPGFGRGSALAVTLLAAAAGGGLSAPAQAAGPPVAKRQALVVLLQNHGYASIGALSESLGSQRFGTRYRYRNPDSGRLDGDVLPVDLAANAASFGLEVIKTTNADEFATAIKQAKAAEDPIVIYVETDPLVDAPSSESWWDVPVSAVSTLESTRRARTTYEEHKATQKLFL